MQWFIPSLILVIVAAIVCIFVIPRLSPYTIGMLAIVMCVMGLWQHYSMFSNEYRASMVLSAMQEYAAYFMVAGVILGLMIVIMTMYGGTPPSIASVIPAMPAAVTNLVPAAITNLTKSANGSSNKGLFNMGATNNKRSNIASTSFMTV